MHKSDKTKRQKYRSGTAWEPKVGYSRAVKVGSHIYVSGTTATGANGEIIGLGDPAAQMRQCLVNIEHSLQHVGANMSDVVRTRMYVVNIDAWEIIGRIHEEVFRDIQPATSMVEVSRLISPDILVEVEADACVDS